MTYFVGPLGIPGPAYPVDPRPWVPLDEARRLVGRTMHVDPENWYWSPDEVRWLAAEWRRAGAGRLPTPPRRGDAARSAVVWFLRLPAPVLFLPFAVALFVAAFVAGWLA
jgi:hypothetical protein